MKAPLPVRPWTLTDCRETAPQVDGDGLRSWTVRAANFLAELTEVDGSAVLARADNPDEYVVVVPAGMQTVAQAAGQELASDGDALFIVPPGTSRLQFRGKGTVLRVFSSMASDVAARAANHADYIQDLPDVAKPRRWPMPAGGLRLQCHALADHVVPANGISRVFRTTNLMLNIMVPYDAPRDPKVLKPHSHGDYEQISVCLQGLFAHHLRTPWAPDSTQWREDAHVTVGSPSTLVIPPRLIHTTQALEAGCWLIDVFGPPRDDFSAMPGFVRNADDFPAPAAA